METAERLAQGDENSVIAHDLRVSVRSVQRWRRAWSQNGPRALASKGPASLPLLRDELFAVLERELAKGPVAYGWPDQTWTLSRIKTLIGRRFHKSYPPNTFNEVRSGWPASCPSRPGRPSEARKARKGITLAGLGRDPGRLI
ncbi:helix-turn-helix domain-containing protein [Streptomyces massasporeus]|uniref:helix-turn-helix domain-containing protein n=1 Tax=Streptomyces massasporeus TaxID=67324 RepID=UPI00378B58FC